MRVTTVRSVTDGFFWALGGGILGDRYEGEYSTTRMEKASTPSKTFPRECGVSVLVVAAVCCQGSLALSSMADIDSWHIPAGFKDGYCAARKRHLHQCVRRLEVQWSAQVGTADERRA